jgi:hypothetical protein
MLEEQQFDNMKTVKTPMAEGFSVGESDVPAKVDEELQTKYRKLLGSLLFLAMWTRPDIAHAVSLLSRFAARPSDKTWTALKRILRYLKGTKNMGIGYSNDPTKWKTFGKHELWGYVDASYANDEFARKSTMGHVLFINGGPVAWKSKLTPIVALSTADAEFIAANFCACEIMFLRHLLKALGFKQDNPTCLYEDNMAAITLATEPALRPRTKHLDVRFMYLMERVLSQDIQMVHCPGAVMIADIMTKPLGPTKFWSFAERICTNRGDIMNSQ